MHGRNDLSRSLWRVCAVALLSAAPLELAAEPVKSEHSALVYIDNDFLGPGQSNIQSLIPLLRTPGAGTLIAWP